MSLLSQDVDRNQKQRRLKGCLNLLVPNILVSGVLFLLMTSLKDVSPKTMSLQYTAQQSCEFQAKNVEEQATPAPTPTNPPEKLKKWDALVSRISPSAHAMQPRVIESLKAGMNVTCPGDYSTKTPCRYVDVIPFVNLTAPDVLSGEFKMRETKSMINPSLYGESSCIVYGIGIFTDSTFEQSMTPFCEVHAFDCTIHRHIRAVRKKAFTFHQTCIGPSTHDAALRNSNSSYTETRGDQAWHFQTLMETMEQLKHHRVDYLKFDTEGAEWSIFHSILELPRNRLPRQIMFEMHTEGANTEWVPPAAVQGKNRPQVNQAVLDLINVGYGILDVRVNIWDSACADISMVLLDDVVGSP